MSRSHVSPRPSNGIFQYVRRVPAAVADTDRRGVVRQSLGTRDRHSALAKARVIDEGLEAYWESLLTGKGARSGMERYQAAVRLAKAMGFAYRPMSQLVDAGLTDDLARRIEVASANLDNKTVVDAVLGAVPEPELRISNIWERYEEFRKAEFVGYSENQLRKHKVPRERAIGYVLAQMGDKALSSITRADVLAYRDWWIDKMKREGLKADSLNRSFSDIKGMLTAIDGALRTNYGSVWERVRIKETNATKTGVRPPFPTEFVQKQILRHGALDSLNHEARMLVYLLVETGLRPSEACNLRPEDIHLDAKVPHVSVSDRADRRLKTDYSIRTVPLVGVALWAMKQVPRGFPRYRDKEDSLSAAVNKALDSAGLRPTKDHVLYSLRHTFQDRVLAAGAPDRLQADLMGHEFDRPKYGEGATLQQKLELLDRIKFDWAPPASAPA